MGNMCANYSAIFNAVIETPFNKITMHFSLNDFKGTGDLPLENCLLLLLENLKRVFTASIKKN